MDTWKAEPCRKHDWERRFRAAPVPILTKGIGFILSTYADGNGTNARPRVELLMQHSELSERTVREHLSALRATGWLLQTAAGVGGRGRPPKAATYRLSYPAEVTAEGSS